LVVEMSPAAAPEEAIGEAPAGSDRHRRELRAPCNIAHRINAFGARRLVHVAGDEAARIEPHPGALEGEIPHGRLPADGPEHAVKGADAAAVGEGRDDRTVSVA